MLTIKEFVYLTVGFTSLVTLLLFDIYHLPKIVGFLGVFGLLGFTLATIIYATVVINKKSTSND